MHQMRVSLPTRVSCRLFALAGAMFVTLGACGGGDGIVVQNTPRVVAVEVNPKTLSMQVGQTQSLTATVRVENAASQAVSWVSSDPARVTVGTSGATATITAVAAGGPVTITATSVADLSKSDFASVTITGTPVASVTLLPSDTSLSVGETAPLRAVARDAGGNELSGRTFAFSSSNAAIATVSNVGVVTALVLGTITIQATSDGRTGTATVRVRPPDLPTALQLRDAAVTRFGAVTSAGEGVYLLGGLLADEFQSGDPAQDRNEIDRRSVSASNPLVVSAYKDLLASRLAAQRAREALIANAASLPAADRWAVNQMYIIQGYIELLLAEHFCNGITLSDFDPTSSALRFGASETVDQVSARSAASFADALQYNQLSSATDAVGLEMQRLATVGRARALVNQGLFNEAKAALGTNPQFSPIVGYRHVAGGAANAVWRLNNNERRYTVADREGTAGANFGTAVDPRLPVTGSSLALDGVTPLRVQQVWPSATASVFLASWTEANLMLAEVDARNGDLATALSRVNLARSSVSGLAPLPFAPTSQLAIDQIFRERAFFLWGTGHRLGDLRRLIRQHGRSAATVFPSGIFAKGGSYGADVNLPISPTDDNNPNYRGCTDRLP